MEMRAWICALESINAEEIISQSFLFGKHKSIAKKNKYTILGMGKIQYTNKFIDFGWDICVRA